MVTSLALALLGATATPNPADVYGWRPTRGGIFGVRLESNKSVFRAGEPIELRVTLINRTLEHYAAGWSPPYPACNIVVRDGRGRIVTPAANFSPAVLRPVTFDFPPRKRVVVTYLDPHGHGLREWISLERWGYALRTPGAYTLIGYPTVNAFEITGGTNGAGFIPSASDTSNSLRITIVR